jgi:hypothetical protein
MEEVDGWATLVVRYRAKDSEFWIRGRLPLGKSASSAPESWHHDRGHQQSRWYGTPRLRRGRPYQESCRDRRRQNSGNRAVESPYRFSGKSALTPPKPGRHWASRYAANCCCSWPNSHRRIRRRLPRSSLTPFARSFPRQPDRDRSPWLSARHA